MAINHIKSVCPYCGVGCGIVMQVEHNRVIKVVGDKAHPSNFGRLCTKGTTCGQAIAESGRMDSAYVRHQRNQDPVRADMDVAISETARRLRGILDRDGPGALAFYVSGQMSLEAQYLANKLAKGFVRTPNIESNSRLCMASAGSGYKLSLGADGPPGSYDDFDKADLFFVIGANMADCHPILFLRMMDRVKAGAKLIVVDPRRSATADKASLFLQIKPGTDLALLNGLLHLLVENGDTDADFIASHTQGWDAMSGFLADYTPANVAQTTGLSEDDIREAARMIGSAAEWMSCWTMGLNQSIHGTWNTNAVCNLHLATGAICRPGSGPFSLTGQPNAMGGREMGYMGPGLPGQRSVLVDADRSLIEDLWHIPRGSVPHQPGGGTIDLFEQMRDGVIKACWIICTNPVASVANRKTVIDALKAAELVITQDAFLDTETNRYADILLPGALWAEAEGVMINSERNLNLTRKAVDAPGQALPDWQIIARVACEMGFAEAFTYASAEDVFEEIKQAWNPATGYDIRGASYARLRDQPLQWPCGPDNESTRNPIRYLGFRDTLTGATTATRPTGPIFPTQTGKAVFFPRPHMPPAERPDDEFPIVLNTGRLQHQWHTLTKTGKVPTLNALNARPFIEVHPDDAQSLGIREGDGVEIRSARGLAVLPAMISERVLPGNCFAPFHWNDVYGDNLAINAVTHDAVDPVSRQPGFKYCAVALRKVELIGHRFLDELNVEASAEDALVDAPFLTVLWASQTGNAEALARQFGDHLRNAGVAVQVSAMDSFPMARLDEVQNVALISSTFGDGESPDNGQRFWQALATRELPLTALRYAVLALGDSSYDSFCQHGKNLDRQLQHLGASSLIPRIDCDGDYRTHATGWFAGLQQALSLNLPTLPVGDHGVALGDHPSRERPYSARLVLNRRLNANGAAKDTRQLALCLEGSGIRYEAGDALGVWPRNCPELVNELLELTRLNAEQPVRATQDTDVPLRRALAERVEIARPGVETLRFIAERNGSNDLKTLLTEPFKSELKDWLWGRQLADVLREFPVSCSAQELLDHL